jgi:hypothetical protein
MNQETSIAKKENAGALSTNIFEDDAGAGSQNITQEDLALPFLKVLGQLSPEVNKQNAKFIKGAEPGMIVNSVTKELHDGAKGINVIPVHYERQYVEWQDRGASSTGAPVAIHSADSAIVSTTTRDKSWKDRLPNGNYLENTANHFVILMGKSPSTALISMRATQLKISKQWNSIMMGLKLQGKNGLFTPPTYSHIYNLKTVQMSNDKGTWFGWDVSKVGPVTDKGVYEIAKNFAKKNNKGLVKVKHGSEEINSSTPY